MFPFRIRRLPRILTLMMRKTTKCRPRVHQRCEAHWSTQCSRVALTTIVHLKLSKNMLDPFTFS